LFASEYVSVYRFAPPGSAYTFGMAVHGPLDDGPALNWMDCAPAAVHVADIVLAVR
jgi:hypothetical protein